MSDFLSGLSADAAPAARLTSLAAVILGAPLLAAAISALFLRKSPRLAQVVSLSAAAAIFVASMRLAFSWDGAAPIHATSELFRLGEFRFDLGFLYDRTAAPMLFVVSFVGLLIHIFSVGYMADDEARPRFFAGLSVFMFSIGGIVLSDNLLMTFVFWELVGFSSYMLIAHYFDREEAAAASKKAFITNRVGDLFFLTGILWAGFQYHAYSFEGLGRAAMGQGGAASAVIGLLLMCGFIGKSAQFPLHVWLTDAMAGPTPVSALIHAATMVAAGVYLMVKLSLCQIFTPAVIEVFLWSGSGMAALAAFCALGQTDIKKSLAYSTLSHLGFMGAAIGLNAPGIALLHMFTHAFFKATLFLCSGSVIHACHHEQDMTRMGGLWKKMPVTTVAFVAAGLSLCAFPYFAGWYSKDLILSVALERKSYGAFALLVLGAIGSTLYIGRMFRLVFLGAPRSEAASHAHESGPSMSVVLFVLTLFSIGGAWFLGADAINGNPLFRWAGGAMNFLLPHSSTPFLSGAHHEAHHAVEHAGLATPMLIAGIVILVAGLAASIRFYKKSPETDALRAVSPLAYTILERRWCDIAYGRLIAFQQRAAEFYTFLFDRFLLEGVAIRGIFAGIPAISGILIRRFIFSGRIGDTAAFFVLGVAIYYFYAKAF